MPELFFCRDLEGYGWCVRKGEYLNIGLGRREHGDLNPHIDDFIAFLERTRPRPPRVARHSGAGTPTSRRGTGRAAADRRRGAGRRRRGRSCLSGKRRRHQTGGRVRTARRGDAHRRAADDAGLEDLKPYEAELRRRYPPRRRHPRALAGVTKALGRAADALAALHAARGDRSLVPAVRLKAAALRRATETTTVTTATTTSKNVVLVVSSSWLRESSRRCRAGRQFDGGDRRDDELLEDVEDDAAMAAALLADVG